MCRDARCRLGMAGGMRAAKIFGALALMLEIDRGHGPTFQEPVSARRQEEVEGRGREDDRDGRCPFRGPDALSSASRVYPSLVRSLIDLLPRPRTLTRRDGSYPLPRTGVVALRTDPAGQRFAAQRLAQALGWSIAGGGGPADASLELDPSIAAQSYRLTIGDSGITLAAGDLAGHFYGVATLCQLVATHGAQLPHLMIEDGPDLAVRGVMLDVSRDKVPHLATLKGLVDLLASWKINQLQLYIEHTFAYRRHPEVWAAASPLTAEDILELDAFCRDRHVELVPNQNSFGHLERWFTHPQYRALAETPGGVELPWGEITRWPFTLSPAHPDSLSFLDGLYDELLPNFTSRRFNANCDETYDLGLGRSRDLVAARGKPQVWLDFVCAIRELAARRGCTLQVWGDTVRRNPALLPALPSDLTILDWGYDRERSLDSSAAALARAGQPFYLCPGTSSWTSLAGRTDNAVANILDAVEAAHRHGAEGVMVTDWGDGGHWQQLPISYLGYAWSAALSWSLAANRELDLPRALDVFAFHDRAGMLGRFAWDLGNAYLQPGFRRGNSSMLYWFYTTTLADVRASWMSRIKHGAAVVSDDAAVRRHMEQTLEVAGATLAMLGRSDPAPTGHALHDPALVKRELAHAAAMVGHAARRVLFELGATTPGADALRAELDAIAAELVALWSHRNRPGGLADSLTKLLRARTLFGD
ncbi:MAG: glycoside hydrolase family 20 zincin-like fold domain-containing protein [Kofleriaceae bacterium]